MILRKIVIKSGKTVLGKFGMVLLWILGLIVFVYVAMYLVKYLLGLTLFTLLVLLLMYFTLSDALDHIRADLKILLKGKVNLPNYFGMTGDTTDLAKTVDRYLTNKHAIDDIVYLYSLDISIDEYRISRSTPYFNIIILYVLVHRDTAELVNKVIYRLAQEFINRNVLRK